MAGRSTQTLLGVVTAVYLVASGCDAGGGDGDTAPVCADALALDLDCDPLYLPTTFDKVFTQTLVPGCAIGTSSCHSPVGAKGGLAFDAADPDAAWASLVEPSDSDPRVVGGVPECSPLVHRLVSDDTAFQMPPGTLLTEPERCAIMHWIRDGALR